MKQALKYQIKLWLVSMIVITATFIGTQATAQSLTTSASQLFRDVYEHRYTWDSQFPGYTAAVELNDGKENYKGHARVNKDMTVEVTGMDEGARQMVENQLRMLIIHRRRVPFEVAHKASTFQFGNTDKTGAVEIFEQQGNERSHYKVLNQQLVQVNRLLGNTAVTVDTLKSEATPEGYLATRYRSTFKSPQTQQVVGVEESEDTYTKIGGYYLPTHEVIHDFEKGELTQAVEFDYSEVQLL